MSNKRNYRAPLGLPDPVMKSAPSSPTRLGGGHVVTFYSYKGGTGRSMTLANTAWILASNGMRVLVIDWDLEAPGLHRYFRPFLLDEELSSTPGVLDMIWEFSVAAMDPSGVADKGWYQPYADLSKYATSLRHAFPGNGTIDFVGAGKQDVSYATKVSVFDWTNFYNRLGGGAFLEALKQSMRAEYDYILIDSRTGLNDTAGICTVQLPDTVVLGFTMNIQSMSGAAAVASSISAQRAVRILPVPMRVEDGEAAKLEASRDHARANFDVYLSDYNEVEREKYWGDIEVPYRALFAYEELLAPIGERARQENTVLAASERIVSYLTERHVTEFGGLPELERRRLLRAFNRDAPDYKTVTARFEFMPAERFVSFDGALSEIELAILSSAAVPVSGLASRSVVDRSGRRLIQKFVPESSGAAEPALVDNFDREVHALVRIAQAYPRPSVPSGVPRLVGYYRDRVEPYLLLQGYHGRPVSQSLGRMGAEEQMRLFVSLLKSIHTIAAAGVVHGEICADNVRWDGSSVQLVNFENSSIAGDDRRVPADDIWGAGVLIASQFAKDGRLAEVPETESLPPVIRGLLAGVFGAPDVRPSASELLARLGEHEFEMVAPAKLEDQLREGWDIFDRVKAGMRSGSEVSAQVSAIAEPPAGESSKVARLWVAVGILASIVMILVVLLLL